MADRKSIVRVQFLADASQLDREMRRAGGTTESTEKKLSDFGKAAVTYLGVQAIGAVREFVSDSVRAFSDLEQSQGGTQAVFGETSKVIDDFARRSAQSIGLSEAEFRTATTLIGGQLKRMTGDVEFAADRSVFLTKVAADLAATYGGTTKEAVEALSAAFRGEADPAERFNLNLKVSEQNAKAVELGLAKTTDEVDDNARAQALLALITEQSADAQGQFAREADTVAGKAQITAATLENHKAIVGETLQAYKDWGNFLQLSMGRALGQLAIDIQKATGELDAGAHAIKSFELASGQAITSIADLDAAIQELQERSEEITLWENIFDDPRGDLADFQWNIDKVIESLDLTKEELEDARDNSHRLATAWGLNAENAQKLADVLDKKLHEAQVEVDEAAARGASEWLRNRDAMDAAETGADELTGSIEEQVDALDALRGAKRRDIDVTFNLLEASREAKQAQDEYNRAVEEFGPASDEAQEAAGDLWRKNKDLIDAALQFRDQAGPNWEAGFRQQMESAGVSQETIQGIIDKVNELDGTIADVNGREIRLKANVTVPKFRFDQDGNLVTPRQTGTAVFAQGGVVTGPTMGLIGEAGDNEAVIPLNRQGMDFLVSALRQVVAPIAAAGTGRGQPVNVTVYALDPQAAARAVVEALQAYERSNGAIPITIRQP